MSNQPITNAQMPALLKQLGFSSAAHQEGKLRRIFISLEGGPGTGKTRFLTTCPGPIAVIDFDRGMEGVAEYDQQGREIVRKSIYVPDFTEKTAPDRSGTSAPAVGDLELKRAVLSIEEFKSTVEKIMVSGVVRTLCIDNAGTAYGLMQAARFGQLARIGEVPSQMWRMAQQEYEKIFNMVYDHNINLIVTHRQKLKFKGAAGETTVDGYDKIPFLAQVHIALSKQVVRPVGAGPNAPADIKLTAKVLKSRQRLALEGTEFEVIWLDDEKRDSVGFDFLTVATAVLPNTTETDWFG
jgi:hypothetical protein